MEAIQDEIKSINSIAAVMETSYANISTDWVLDINCYSTNMPDPNLEFDMKQGLITGKMCVPCDPLKGKSESNYHAKKTKNGHENNVLNSSKHSASSLSTCSISFPGLLEIKKVNSFLDEILFSNGARVGGGYRQPNFSYIDLSKKESPIEQVPLENDVVVYTSAPQLIPVVNKSNHSNMNENEMKIFRIKGVLHVNSQEYIQLLQAVFDIFEIKDSSFLIGSNDDMSLGLNRIVVIGRNIDKDEIEEGFLSCLL
jgi:G3E family GTPase